MEFQLKKFHTPIVVSKIANIHYFEFTDKYHTDDDSHSFCELVYVDKGMILVRADNFHGELLANQLIIHRENETHSLECINKVQPNIIIIGFECKSEYIECFAKRPVTLSTEAKRLLAEVVKEGMSVYAPPYDVPNTLSMKKRNEYPFGADQMIKLKLESFLITLIREREAAKLSADTANKDDETVQNVRRYIEEHYAEKILLENLCFIFGTNKTTLCRIFKEKCGMTVLSYINSLKIKEAKVLLSTGGDTVTQVSERLGFASVHYFCRLFHKMEGISPKEYAARVAE